MIDFDLMNSGNLDIDNLYSNEFGDEVGLTEEWTMSSEEENITLVRQGDERG